MKITIGNWGEQDHGKSKIYEASDRVHLRATEAVSLILVAEGHEALAGTGTEIDVTFKEEGVKYYVLGPKTARVFVETKPKKAYQNLAEVFTNIDRQPADNPLEVEVRKIIRRDRLLARQQARADREAARKANAQFEVKTKAKEDPKLDEPTLEDKKKAEESSET